MKDYYPDVTFEDGVFRFDLPNGDEFVIVPPKPRELSDEELADCADEADIPYDAYKGYYVQHSNGSWIVIDKYLDAFAKAILKKASEK
jgi:hypothetical protein